jgi:hypothetical protein
MVYLVHTMRFQQNSNYTPQLVSRRTKAEVLSLLAGTTVRFHCHKCFEELLANISLGLGVGSNWMKHIEIVLDLSTQMTRRHYLTLEVGRMMARETMEVARKTGWMYWGRRDLRGRERWRYEVMKEDGCQSSEEATLPLPGYNVGQITQMLPTPTVFALSNGPQHIGAMVQQQAAMTSAPVKWLISGWFDGEGGLDGPVLTTLEMLYQPHQHHRRA